MKSPGAYIRAHRVERTVILFLPDAGRQGTKVETDRVRRTVGCGLGSVLADDRLSGRRPAVELGAVVGGKLSLEVRHRFRGDAA